jgi:hypothetical protein
MSWGRSALSSATAKACAVRRIFLICRPLSGSAAKPSRNASSHQSGKGRLCPLVTNVVHKSRREEIDNAGYLIARWMRDLNAASKVPTRFVVRIMMPS